MVLYGWKYRSLIYWFEFGNKRIMRLKLIQIMLEKINVIREKLQTVQNR